MPTPSNSREQGRSSSLAARTKNSDRNGRVLLKFNIFVFRTLRKFIENIFFTIKT
jgi:hypothetical protein